MRTHFLPIIESNELKEKLQILEENEAVRSIFVLMADIPGEEIGFLDDLFKSIKKPIIGGVFPGIIVDSVKRDQGALLLGLDFSLACTTIALADDSLIFGAIQSAMPTYSLEHKSIFTIIDAFGDNKGEYIHSLYDVFGNSLVYAGGGSGSLDMVRKPCVITNEGIQSNVAVLAILDKALPIGCAHGWQEISEPLKITEAIGNKVISINWNPAFDVYKELIGKHSGTVINSENFFSVAKSYPLGMAKVESEYVVRDPIMTDESTITIVDEIPTGEFVYLLHGNEALLLDGAAEAARLSGIENSNPVFCVDCISRVLFMGDNFSNELRTISSNSINGFLAIGEIANSGNSYLEIYNKTIVVTQL